VFLRDLRGQQDSRGVLALLEKRETKDHRDPPDYKDR
jgi:hypothetical protein